MKLTSTVKGNSFTFSDVKAVMARANEQKSGDELAGVAATSDMERVAAKRVLADLTLNDIRENPAAPYEQDEVTRLIEADLDKEVFGRVRDWTVAQLREHVLSANTSGEDLLALGRGLTSECIAAVAKLMTNLDLALAASKIRVITHANTTLGLRGRFSVRLQPNHTTDSPDGILASTMEGLSWGMGDALIGVNPVTDTWDATSAILHRLYEFTRAFGVPTQICWSACGAFGDDTARGRFPKPVDVTQSQPNGRAAVRNFFQSAEPV